MSFLSAAQDAIARLVGRRPAAVVSSTEEICVEITAIAQDAAEDLLRAHDWQQLTEFHEIVADGVSPSFAFPSDYDRMVQATELFNPKSWCWNYTHIADYGEWLIYFNSGAGWASPGIWTIRKNQFHFLPVPAVGTKAVFPYISKRVFSDENGNTKDRLSADTDLFVLNDRLLTLGIVWRWLALKRMDYSQELDDYNVALSQEMATDKGARVIRKGGQRLGSCANIAYPRLLGGI